MPDDRTVYSSHRRDAVDDLAWPVVSEHALDMLRAAGEVLHPEPGELLWDAGDPYDLNLVLSGGVLLVDRRDDRARAPGLRRAQPDPVPNSAAHRSSCVG